MMFFGFFIFEVIILIFIFFEIYFGIFLYFFFKVICVKEVVFFGWIKFVKFCSCEVLVVFQGVFCDQFFEVLEELKWELGEENVEVNDKFLKDGWYMEYFNMYDMMIILDEEEFVVGVVVYLGNIDEVVKIVKWVNRWFVFIFFIFMGRNCKFL